ncbi:MAG: sporulation protein YqfD, partial [Clostridia bacterium]|nr:sporulation protein YqfD [Clostridia bacterium]
MFTLYDSIQINGIMPERALLRLKRAGIPLYNVQRAAKTKIRLRVRRKDLSKISAIYPREGDMEKRGAYVFSVIEGLGLAKLVDFCKNRTGFLLGIMAFCILTLAADSFVFGIEFVGTDVYAREVAQALDENGIRFFAPYKKGKEDMITAKLLTLDYVDFCSVTKKGGKIRVEMRTSPFAAPLLSTGEMQAKHTGEILAITALRGTALKKAGESVFVGETLVA